MKPQSEASMMVYFRERINIDLVKKINQKMVKNFQAETEETPREEKKRRSAIGKQLKYIKRNLSHIDSLINSGAELSSLSPRKYKMLLVVTEVYRQQWQDV